MRNTEPKKDKRQASMPAPAGRPGRWSFEWPLLIYPVLFLTALGLLYLVSRSTQRGAPASLSSAHTTGQAADVPGLASDAPGTAANPAASLAAAPNAQPPKPARPGGAAGHPILPDNRAAKPARSSALATRMRQAVEQGQVQGSAKTAALLCIAVDDNNHARIKQCLDELAARGDEAVVPLNDLMAGEEGDTGLWAATALARIGTPMATTALLDRLAQTKEGSYKEQLCQRISNLSNHDSWPLLLDAVVRTDDTAVVRAAGASLSGMADAPVLDAVISRYEKATTDTEILRLADLIRNVRSPKATESLLSLAGPVSAPSQDLLQDAAIEALARVGDAQCVSYLLRRLEASAPGEDGPIYNTITGIDSPRSQDALLYAAAGSKEVSAGHGRTAAIYALKNYPNEKTVALLERIVAGEQNEKVLTAATRTLDAIQQGPHTVTASADALQESEQVLPLTPVQK